MKVALLGNMNNMLFQQQRYFEDWGYETVLYLFEESAHFMPEADVFFDPYEKYKIIYLGWNVENFHGVSKQEIYDLFSGFDVLVGTDVAPAYLYKAGLKLDIFCLHGSDVYEYPFYKLGKKNPSLWTVNKYNFSLCQYEGIKLAEYLALYKMDDLYEKPISIIRKKGKRMASAAYLYTPQLTASYFELSSMAKNMKSLKENFSFIVFHHCSHNWHTAKDLLTYKGNDKVIKAFAAYYNRSSEPVKACLVLLEYGPDVGKSKDLIKALHIESNVFWFPKQNRKDLLSAINLSDIGIGELGVQGWMLYSVIVEFLILKKPSIHYRNSDIYKSQYKDLYNMIDTNDPEVVTSVLLDYEKNPAVYAEMGESANQWFLDNLHYVSLAEFRKKIVEVKACSNKITWKDYAGHSNIMGRLKVYYWLMVNVLKIKLKIT